MSSHFVDSDLTPPIAPISAADDDLHSPLPQHGYQATETSFFGFSIPEKGISAEIYFWFHPVLQVASGGLFIWQGMKRETLQAEYFNYQNYLPYPANGISNYATPFGLEISTIEPGKRFSVRHRDDAADTSLKLELEGLCPPIGRPGGGHLVQPMRTRGTLRLNGVEHDINGFTTRDRSWQEERAEDRRYLPPLTWMVGVFGDDLAFHAVAFDDPEKAPDLHRQFPGIGAANRLRWGYLLENGRVIRVIDCSKTTARASDGVTPVSYALRLTLEDHRELEIEGRVRANLPMQWWPNMTTHMSMTEWRLGGRTGWGDAQDIQYNPFISRSLRWTPDSA